MTDLGLDNPVWGYVLAFVTLVLGWFPPKFVLERQARIASNAGPTKVVHAGAIIFGHPPAAWLDYFNRLLISVLFFGLGLGWMALGLGEFFDFLVTHGCLNGCTVLIPGYVYLGPVPGALVASFAFLTRPRHP